MIHRRFASTILLTAFLLAVSTSVTAQNNPYQIADTCYVCMLKADALIGREGFSQANEALLLSAILSKDKKAQVLYYVEKMRDACARKNSTDEEVLAAQEELKTVARENGYLQYFYQSYQFAKNYFFNRDQHIRALEIMQEMQNTAVAEGNEYGKWLAEKEIASYYQVFGAYQAARSHIRAIIQTYRDSQDPVIRRQSLCPYYLDYSATFPPEADSARFYVDKAWEVAVVPVDSVKCMLASAKLAAVDGDYQKYAYYRDLCLQSPHKQAIGRTTPALFSCIDALFDGSYDRADKSVFSRLPSGSLALLSSVAERVSRPYVALDLKDHCIRANRDDFAWILESNMAEMNARYENDQLQASLSDKSREVERTTRLALLLGLLLMLGAVFGLLLYVRNLRRNQRKDERMIAELTAAKERAVQADAAKDRFIQNMTHELRTPLNAITGFSQLLALPDGMFSPEEKDEFGNHVINSTKMMTMLLDDLMSTSAMDSGGYRINIEDAECENICREAMRSAEHRVQAGVNMLFLPDMDLPFAFRGDPMRIQQVLTNLLTNAGKHTAAGEIRLGCSLKENPGMLTFSVEDTGSGIPASEAERIFERFVKLDDFVQGTGLGLSICREITNKMGGKIFLDTAYNGGARFVFCVPLS